MTRSSQRGSRKRRINRLAAWLGRPGTEPVDGCIRPGRVLAARARIASGHYDRPEVQDYLLDALIEALKKH